MFVNLEIISLFIPPWLLIIVGSAFSFTVTFIGIPAVVKVANIRRLFDEPGARRSHYISTPRLGGTIIFAGVILSSVMFTSFSNAYELKYIIAGMLVLFFIGLKDDIVSLSPLKKAIGQLFAALIIVIPGSVRITDLYGILGVSEVPFFLSVVLSLLAVLALINTINFIDGIDGLASGVGILTSAIFGSYFIAIGHISYSVMCFALTGSLVAFFWFNVFSQKNKIFMGDTGAMIIGLLLAVFAIRFLNLNSDNASPLTFDIAPALTLAILFVPVFDALRVLIIRFINGRSVFIGDRNHLHHRALSISGSHLKATLTLLAVNVVLIIVTYLLREAGNTVLIILILILGAIFSACLGLRLIKINNHNGRAK